MRCSCGYIDFSEQAVPDKFAHDRPHLSGLWPASATEAGVNLHETARIDLDTCGWEIERRRVRYPSHRHDRERRFGTFSSMVFGKYHPRAAPQREPFVSLAARPLPSVICHV